MERTYSIVLIPEPEEGGYSVEVPALPGCVTQGETVEECLAMARDAIELFVESLIDAGEPVPVEAERPQVITLNVSVKEPLAHR